MKTHILGICGSMTTPLAVSLVSQGHQVSGSDQQKIYPPFSNQLANAKISVNQQPINNSLDLVIVGGSYATFDNTRLEFEQTKSLNIKYISATEYIAQNLAKTNSFLVAGSYGKTTITAILTWALDDLSLNPSYFVAGQFVNPLPSFKFASSDYSIIEAGEDFHGLETHAKFLYYPVKYLILTSANWEHKDCYLTESDNLEAYKQLLQRIPQDGILVYNPNDADIQKILPFCQSTKIPYKRFPFQSSLIGKYNQNNIDAVLTLCEALKFDTKKIISDIKNFKGVKRRLEVLLDKQGIVIIDDFAQSPPRIAAALAAVHEQYPQSNIKCYFEPQASFLLTQTLTDLQSLANSFSFASEIVLGPLRFSPQKRITFADYLQVFGDKIQYIPVYQDIYTHYSSTLKSNDILVHFSSGGLDGLNTLNQIINFYKGK
jgi:UDP-N-acetylmuramate: L-alanyl-gamma-D-glutamyl-meso-diaminopimelate ligase